jgi:hypothetical protein
MDTYISRNTLNGKFYIGSTTNFQERKLAHLRSKDNYPFQNALRKNPEAFEWEVYTDDSENRELEQALLDMFFGTEMCYNLSPVVSQPPRYEWTEEQRKAAGERAKQRGTDHLRTPEAIEKMKETKRNNPTVLTEEMRKARSRILLGNDRKKGKKESEETCRKKSEAFTGMKKPNQTLAMIGRTWWTHPDGRRKFQRDQPGPEWENRYSPSKTKKERSSEYCQKMSENAKKRFKGKKHWVNEKGEKKFQLDSPGPGWQNGRVYRPETGV